MAQKLAAGINTAVDSTNITLAYLMSLLSEYPCSHPDANRTHICYRGEQRVMREAAHPKMTYEKKHHGLNAAGWDPFATTTIIHTIT